MQTWIWKLESSAFSYAAWPQAFRLVFTSPQGVGGRWLCCSSAVTGLPSIVKNCPAVHLVRAVLYICWDVLHGVSQSHCGGSGCWKHSSILNEEEKQKVLFPSAFGSTAVCASCVKASSIVVCMACGDVCFLQLHKYPPRTHRDMNWATVSFLQVATAVVSGLGCNFMIVEPHGMQNFVWWFSSPPYKLQSVSGLGYGLEQTLLDFD